MIYLRMRFILNEFSTGPLRLRSVLVAMHFNLAWKSSRFRSLITSVLTSVPPLLLHSSLTADSISFCLEGSSEELHQLNLGGGRPDNKTSIDQQLKTNVISRGNIIPGLDNYETSLLKLSRLPQTNACFLRPSYASYFPVVLACLMFMPLQRICVLCSILHALQLTCNPIFIDCTLSCLLQYNC